MTAEERFADAALGDARAMNDAQLALMLRVATERRDGLASTGPPWLADRLNVICCALAQVRDERVQLARETDDAVNPFTVTPLGDTES